jgi:adenylate cyclase
MATEIERKFLVKRDKWKTSVKGKIYRQGYLSSVKERVVRVRTIENKGFLTIKGITKGVSRSEFEYEISVEDANIMLDEICEKPIIEKKRYKIPVSSLIFEVDEFFGENEGLVVAEVELADENQKIDFPVWIGAEVSGDPRYFNSNLIQHPFKKW